MGLEQLHCNKGPNDHCVVVKKGVTILHRKNLLYSRPKLSIKALHGHNKGEISFGSFSILKQQINCQILGRPKGTKVKFHTKDDTKGSLKALTGNIDDYYNSY